MQDNVRIGDEEYSLASLDSRRVKAFEKLLVVQDTAESEGIANYLNFRLVKEGNRVRYRDNSYLALNMLNSFYHLNELGHRTPGLDGIIELDPIREYLIDEDGNGKVECFYRDGYVTGTVEELMWICSVSRSEKYRLLDELEKEGYIHTVDLSDDKVLVIINYDHIAAVQRSMAKGEEYDRETKSRSTC